MGGSMNTSRLFKGVLDLVENDEPLALEVMAALAHKFGWTGPLYTRLDVENLWKELYPDRSFDDTVWEKVRRHPKWKGVHEILREECWKDIHSILTDIAENRI